MPITVNESGVLYELDTVTANEGGVLYELDTVHANEGGTLFEIFSTLPKSLTWTADASADSSAKIISTDNNGLTVTFKSQTANAGHPDWDGTYDAVFSSEFKLSAGTMVSGSISNITSSGANLHSGIFLMQNGEVVTEITSEGTAVKTAGIYYLALRGHAVTGSQTGISYYPITATATVEFIK